MLCTVAILACRLYRPVGGDAAGRGGITGGSSSLWVYPEPMNLICV